ncbi:hypothetical protein [Paenibacillus pabuli]|uniref:hypothetical protein n=1 Tax=Paenibacillus pabuli TaxID=1472 RepID=UPI003CF1D45D
MAKRLFALAVYLPVCSSSGSVCLFTRMPLVIKEKLVQSGSLVYYYFFASIQVHPISEMNGTGMNVCVFLFYRGKGDCPI